jgi:hypothetical protein
VHGPQYILTRSVLKASLDVMPDDVRKDDGVPPHDLVLAVPGRQVQEPCNRRGFSALASRRLDALWATRWQVVSHRRSLWARWPRLPSSTSATREIAKTFGDTP